GKEGVGICIAEPVDDGAHEAEQQDLEQGDARAENSHRRQPLLGAVAIVEAEGKQALRRLARLCQGIGVQPLFKPAQHVVYRSIPYVRTMTEAYASGVTHAVSSSRPGT